MSDLLDRNDLATSERLPVAFLAATYLSHAVTTVGSVIAVVVFLVNPDVWPGQWAIAVFGAIFLIRAIDPLYDRATTRIIISDSELTVVSGLIARRVRTIPWRTVKTLESHAPWSHRVFGLVRVRVAQGGDFSTQITLPGVTRAMRDRIAALSPVDIVTDDEPAPSAPDDVVDTDAAPVAPRVVEAPAPAEPEAAAEDERTTLLYRATLGDLVVASILFGRFAVVGLAIAFALFEQLENLGLLGALFALRGLGAIGFAVLVAVVILAIGVAASVVRYARFEVRRTEAGGIQLVYGLIETRERFVDAPAITGVVLQRNALEMLLGRARLVLLTTDTSQQFGANLLLPSLPRRTVARILGEGFDARVPAENLATRRRSPFVSLGVLVAVTAVAGALGWLVERSGLPLGLALAAGLVAWALIVLSLRPFVTRLSLDRSRDAVVLRSRLLVEREVHLDILAVHFVTSAALRSHAFLATVHYFAGEARQRSAWRFAATDLVDIQRRLGDRGARVQRIAQSRAEARERRAVLDAASSA